MERIVPYKLPYVTIDMVQLCTAIWNVMTGIIQIAGGMIVSYNHFIHLL